MDVHKPKPWHGWREFLKEYAIIVIGVLTALAAEQGVEWLHWRHQAEAVEAQLTAEVRSNLLSAYSRINKQRCYDARLSWLSTRLRSGEPWRGAAILVGPAPSPETIPPLMRAGIYTSASPPVYMASHALWPDSSWTAAVSNGVMLHLAQERIDRYSYLYKLFAGMRDAQAAEYETAAKLSALAFDRPLSEPERTHFLEELGQLSFWNVQLASDAMGVIRIADRAGIQLRKADVAKLIDTDRHYFLSKDCAESITVPFSSH